MSAINTLMPGYEPGNVIDEKFTIETLLPTMSGGGKVAMAVQSSPTVGIKKLVGNLKALGIEIPKTLSEELELSKKIKDDGFTREAARNKARTALETAHDQKSFLKARDEYSALLASETASNDPGFQSMIGGIIDHRVSNAMFDANYGFQVALASQFNTVVDDFGLNQSVGSLPDFQNDMFRLVDMSPVQASTLNTWKQAVEQLHPIWSAFKSLADLNGVDLGSSQDIGPNIDMAYVLGDVPEHRYVMSPNPDVVDAQQELMNWKLNVKSSQVYGRLAPFILLSICNIPLQLSTVHEAAEQRRKLQLGEIA